MATNTSTFRTFGSRLVDYPKSVSGEIDIHPVSGTVFDMANGVGLEHELPELHSEGCMKVSVWMARMILFVQLLDRHAFRESLAAYSGNRASSRI